MVQSNDGQEFHTSHTEICNLNAFDILAQVIKSEPYKVKHTKTQQNQKVWNVFAHN